ncbi:MAG: NAD-dependent epimerase/dehydratase family protein [Deltaproteobacteria bacterium]|nr:MAG: NAD-dependent epimerase/dehydratase family protein [Deltaproteobacteria bacterium]
MRYLVTGGAGFIGSHLVDALTARNDSVLIVDDLSTGRLENVEHLLDSELVEFVEGSVVDARLVDECMRSVDACMHLASAVGVQLVVSRPLDSLLKNIRGGDVVISAAARHDRKLLFTSTSEVYGKNSAGALSEDSDRILGSPFKSRWSYATAKAFGEALASSYARERGSSMVVVRLFNTVGPRQTGAYGMVLPRLVSQALANEDLTVYGNGTQSRCFCHVLDAVRALVLLADSDDANGRVFTVGSSTEVPIVELARRVIEHVRADSSIRFIPYEEAYDDGFEELGRRIPDTTALRNLTGWTPTRSVDEAIKDVIAYERSGLTSREVERIAG